MSAPPPSDLAATARTEGGPIVTGERVRRTFGTTRALDDVTFEITSGITGLLGPNGAGKTTLISLLLGLHPPDAGELTVLGRTPSVAGHELRARLGYAPEYESLPDDVRAQDFVRHIAELHGLDRRTAIERATETLVLLGLGEERLRELGTMSTGQRQRVKLAQAVVHDPALVLLDEPTNGLDPLQRDEMLDLVRRLGSELGLDIVVSSHLLHELEQICDAVVVLSGGRVVASHRLGEVGGEDRTVTVETIDDAEVLVRRLVDAGLEPHRLGATEMLVTAVGDDDLDRIRDAVADTGVGLRRLQRTRMSLEDVFLDEVGAEAAG